MAGQVGWKFTSDASFPTRSPNADLFLHGRTGQTETAWHIQGANNVLVAPVVEGTTRIAFEIDHPTSRVGCVGNTVTDAYVEGAAGATAFYVGRNSVEASIVDPFITSLGLSGTLISDNGTRTRIRK